MRRARGKSNMKSIIRFVKHYKQFSFAVSMALLAAILTLVGQSVVGHWLLAAASIVVAIPLFISMIRDLREGTYGVDILAVTAIVTAVVMREYWTAIVIVLMLTGGEALEDYAENRARREMSALLDNAPRRAHVLRGKKTIDMPVKAVEVGFKIVIRPGEIVPADAVIIDGSASFDEASITGESLPVQREVGDEILSGSVLQDQTVVARAVRSAADSQYEQIVTLVRSAAKSKAPFVRMADRFAVPFTLIAFVIAIGAWLISGDSLRFLQVMVVATPCPLILAAPIAIISGMSRASKIGVIVKNGTALERLSSARSFAFDKTGTLTHGKLVVSDVRVSKPFSREQVIGYAAALEQHSNHIVARAVIDSAVKKGYAVPKVKRIKEVSGRGLIAGLKGQEILVGRVELLREHGVEVSEAEAKASAVGTSTLVSVGGKLAGIIYFDDELRGDSQTTVSALRQRGIEDIYLITGDKLSVAKRVARQVGISAKHIVAEALPIDKLKTVERVAKAPVAFVGDGVNDAPVLVASDVGIALGAKGSSAASESADIVVMQDSLSRVAETHAIARRTFMIARQSIWVGIGLSVMLMLVFATGRFSPVTGAVVQELVDVVVIFNALRAHVAGRRTG